MLAVTLLLAVILSGAAYGGIAADRGSSPALFTARFNGLVRLQSEAGRQLGEADRNTAISRGLAGVGVACTLAALTTVAGFASLGVASMPALSHFGLYAAVGMGLMLVTSVVILPWGFSFARSPGEPFGGPLRALLDGVRRPCHGPSLGGSWAVWPIDRRCDGAGSPGGAGLPSDRGSAC